MDRDIKFFKAMVKLDEKTLFLFLEHFLKSKYRKVYTSEDYIYAVGDIPVGLVAHCDTVWPQPPNELYYDEEQQVMWSPDGAGFDDRAGVAAIIEIIEAGYRPTIIFTTGEELGGIGATHLVKDFSYPVKKLNFLIELDRAGKDDVVTYSNCNKDFIKYIESFGFKYNTGSFSDVEFIGPYWDLSYANLSIGYEREHTILETQYLKYWDQTIEKVKKILDDDSQYFNYVEDRNSFMSQWKNLYGSGYERKCSCCGKYFYDYEMIEVKIRGEVKYVCPSCEEKYVDYCSYCHEPYFIGEEHICK